MMQTLVATVLVDDNENDVLRFSFPDNVKLDVSLTGENGNHQLKEFFEKLLTFHLKDDVEVDFKPTDGYRNAMYEQVCRAYVDTLANELSPVRTEIIKEGLAMGTDDAS